VFLVNAISIAGSICDQRAVKHIWYQDLGKKIWIVAVIVKSERMGTANPVASQFGSVSYLGNDHDPALSVVAPMFNEEGGACTLVDEIVSALEGMQFEIIVVDDNSTDATFARLCAHMEKVPALRIVHHHSNAGQSRAIRTGILAARASVIVTLDGDGQNDPADIPAVYEKLIATDHSLIAGERVARKDSAAKRVASRLANKIRQAMLNDGAADTGCGLKAFKRDAYLRLPYFDHQHRYLPALFAREGAAMSFVPVGHRPRLHGNSKYTNLGRLAVAFRDIMGVMWLNRRFKSPISISEVQNASDYDSSVHGRRSDQPASQQVVEAHEGE